MTYQQLFRLAELEADLVYERYLEAIDADEHLEIPELLNTEASVARHKYCDAYHADLAL